MISVAKMAPVLERIADHACNIARAAIAKVDEPLQQPGTDAHDDA